MSIVEEGLYVIEPAVEGALAIGVVPFIYPPPTVPVRVLSGYLVDKQLVRKDDGFAIADSFSPKEGYSIIRKGDTAYVSWEEGFPKAWRFDPAGPGVFVIKEPSGDSVFTRVETKEDGAHVHLKRADGTLAQRWKLVRIDRA